MSLFVFFKPHKGLQFLCSLNLIKVSSSCEFSERIIRLAVCQVTGRENLVETQRSVMRLTQSLDETYK